MISARFPVPERVAALGLLALSVGGCSSILGLDDFGASGEGGGSTGTGSPTATGTGTDATTSTTAGPGSGGGTSSTTTGSGGGTSSTTTGSGGGGAGGGGTTCTALAPFEVMTPAELGATVDAEAILASQRPPNDNRVHVGVLLTTRQLAVRTVRTGQQTELSNLVLYPPVADAVNRRFVGSYATLDAFHVYGHEDNVLGEWVFPADSDIGQPPTFVPYQVPASCTELRAIEVSQAEDGSARYAATCNSVGNQAMLFAGRVSPPMLDVTLPPVPQVNGSPPDNLLVAAYFRNGNEHVMITNAEDFPNSRPFLRRGSSAAELGTAVPFVLPPDEVALVFHGPTVGGKTFVGMLHADPDTIFTPDAQGGYASGALAPGDFVGFAQDPFSKLPGAFGFSGLEEIAPVFQISGGAEGFVGGGVSNFDLAAPSRVRLYLWDPQGMPLVSGFPVFEAVDPVRPLVGTATLGGFGGLLSVWAEDLGGATSRVRAARVQCITQ